MKFNIQNPAFLQMAGRSGKGISLFYVTSHVDENDITFANTKLGAFADNVEYSTDNAKTWNQLTADTVITLGESDTVYFRNYTKEVYSAAMGTNILKTSDLYSVGGNITALFYPGGDLPAYAFKAAFEKDTNLISASALTLPATTLAESCYGSMFSRCTGLTDAPTLPATTLAKSCYGSMFSRCTGLTSAPTLPATTLAESCYSSMFNGCTGLTSAPTLPATTLANSCYISMFSGCTGLTDAPTLPATTLAEFCYGSMFNGCTGLTSAPTLPATTLAESCYGSMFNGCTGLTSAPTLPATTLAGSCYSSMFNGCTGLTSAPTLPATTLAEFCYSSMFSRCTGLNKIICKATDISAIECTANWVYGVSATGTFEKPAAMNDWTTGDSGIPNNWTVISPH